MSSKAKAKALADEHEDDELASMLELDPSTDRDQWRRDSNGDLDWAYTASAVRTWSPDALLNHLWEKSFSIPPREYNPSAPFVWVQLANGDIVTLPHGYRLPLMFVAKYRWETIHMRIRNAKQWRAEKANMLHLSRLCENLFRRAQAKAARGGMEKGWRCIMFDRLLARFYKHWARNDPQGGTGFVSTHGAKEYDRDVLKHDWKRWCLRGLNDVRMTEDEVVEGITIAQFRKTLVKGEDGQWTIDGEALVHITGEIPAEYSSLSELSEDDYDMVSEDESSDDEASKTNDEGNQSSDEGNPSNDEGNQSNDEGNATPQPTPVLNPLAKRTREDLSDRDTLERALKRTRIELAAAGITTTAAVAPTTPTTAAVPPTPPSPTRSEKLSILYPSLTDKDLTANSKLKNLPLTRTLAAMARNPEWASPVVPPEQQQQPAASGVGTDFASTSNSGGPDTSTASLLSPTAERLLALIGTMNPSALASAFSNLGDPARTPLDEAARPHTLVSKLKALHTPAAATTSNINTNTSSNSNVQFSTQPSYSTAAASASGSTSALSSLASTPDVTTANTTATTTATPTVSKPNTRQNPYVLLPRAKRPPFEGTMVFKPPAKGQPWGPPVTIMQTSWNPPTVWTPLLTGQASTSRNPTANSAREKDAAPAGATNNAANAGEDDPVPSEDEGEGGDKDADADAGTRNAPEEEGPDVGTSTVVSRPRTTARGKQQQAARRAAARGSAARAPASASTLRPRRGRSGTLSQRQNSLAAPAAAAEDHSDSSDSEAGEGASASVPVRARDKGKGKVADTGADDSGRRKEKEPQKTRSGGRATRSTKMRTRFNGRSPSVSSRASSSGSESGPEAEPEPEPEPEPGAEASDAEPSSRAKAKPERRPTKKKSKSGSGRNTKTRDEGLDIPQHVLNAKALELLVSLVDVRQVLASSSTSTAGPSNSRLDDPRTSSADAGPSRLPEGDEGTASENRQLRQDDGVLSSKFQDFEGRFESVKNELAVIVGRLQVLEDAKEIREQRETRVGGAEVDKGQETAMTTPEIRMERMREVVPDQGEREMRELPQQQQVETTPESAPDTVPQARQKADGVDVEMSDAGAREPAPTSEGVVPVPSGGQGGKVSSEMSLQTDDEHPKSGSQETMQNEEPCQQPATRTPSISISSTSVEMQVIDHQSVSEVDSSEMTVNGATKDDLVDPRMQVMSSNLSLLVDNLVSVKMLSVMQGMVKGKTKDNDATADHYVTIPPPPPSVTPPESFAVASLLDELKAMKDELRAREQRDKDEMQAMRELHSAEVDALRRRLSYLENGHSSAAGAGGARYRSASSSLGEGSHSHNPVSASAGPTDHVDGARHGYDRYRAHHANGRVFSPVPVDNDVGGASGVQAYPMPTPERTYSFSRYGSERDDEVPLPIKSQRKQHIMSFPRAKIG